MLSLGLQGPVVICQLQYQSKQGRVASLAAWRPRLSLWRHAKATSQTRWLILFLAEIRKPCTTRHQTQSFDDRSGTAPRGSHLGHALRGRKGTGKRGSSRVCAVIWRLTLGFDQRHANCVFEGRRRSQVGEWTSGLLDETNAIGSE